MTVTQSQIAATVAAFLGKDFPHGPWRQRPSRMYGDGETVDSAHRCVYRFECGDVRYLA